MGCGVYGVWCRVKGEGCRVEGGGCRGSNQLSAVLPVFLVLDFARVLACLRVLISHTVFLKSFCKSQFPHKSVNLFFTLVIAKDKLRDLWGS